MSLTATPPDTEYKKLSPRMWGSASGKPVLIAGPRKQPGNAMAADVDYVDVVKEP